MSKLSAIQNGFKAKVLRVDKLQAPIQHPGPIPEQQVGPLVRPSTSRLFYAENTTWLVTVSEVSVSGTVPNRADIIIYKINNNTGEIDTMSCPAKGDGWKILDALRYVGDNRLVFADYYEVWPLVDNVSFAIAYLIVDGKQAIAGIESYIEVHPVLKDEAFLANRKTGKSFGAAYGTSGGNIGILWWVNYDPDPKAAVEQRVEVTARLEIDTGLNIVSNSVVRRKTGTPGDPSMRRTYTAIHQGYVVSRTLAAGAFDVIDMDTLEVVYSQTAPGSSGFYPTYSSIDAHLIQRRNGSYAEELYGRGLVGLLTQGRSFKPPGSHKDVYEGCHVVHIGGSGEVETTYIHAVIYDIAAIDKEGNVYCSVLNKPAREGQIWSRSFNKYDSSGSLLWSGYNRAYLDRYASNGYLRNRNLCRFDEEMNLVITSTYGRLTDAPPDYTSCTDYATVIDKDTGKQKSYSVQSDLPRHKGNYTMPIGTFDKYNPTTDQIEVMQIAVEELYSGITETAKVPSLLVGKLTAIYYLNIRVVGEDDEPIHNRDFLMRGKLNGQDRYLVAGDNQLSLGDKWEVEITSFGYESATASGTLSIDEDSREATIVLKRKEWIRRQYEVRTPQELQDIGKDALGEYHIMNDIDMMDFEWQKIYVDATKPFMGAIVGNGHTIKNLVINKDPTDTSGASSGLICNSLNATFEDINMENCEMYCFGNAGFISGTLAFTTIYSDDPDETVKPYLQGITITDSTIHSSEYSRNIGTMVGQYTSKYFAEETVSTEVIPFSECIATKIKILVDSSSGSDIGGIVGLVEVGGSY